MSTPNRLTKMTVNLTPATVAALNEAVAAGNTKSGTINRALPLWAWFQQATGSGSVIKVVSPDGKEHEVRLF